MSGLTVIRQTATTLAAIFLLCYCQHTMADRRLYSVHLEPPRGYGYHVGDHFMHSTTVRVAEDFEIDRATAPKTGDVSPWLKILEVQIENSIEADVRSYLIQILYQIRGFRPDSDVVTTPLTNLVFESSRGKIPVLIQPQDIRISRLVEDIDEQAFTDIPVAQPIGPRIRNTQPLQSAKWLCFGLAAAMALWLMWSTLYQNYRSRPLPPFQQALKEIKRLCASDPPQVIEARRRLHEAFNRRYGKTVFESALSDFYKHNPPFRSEDETIRRFFNDSTEIFFARDNGSAALDSDGTIATSPARGSGANSSEYEHLISLATRCAKLEKRKVR